MYEIDQCNDPQSGRQRGTFRQQIETEQQRNKQRDGESDLSPDITPFERFVQKFDFAFHNKDSEQSLEQGQQTEDNNEYVGGVVSRVQKNSRSLYGMDDDCRLPHKRARTAEGYASFYSHRIRYGMQNEKIRQYGS